MAQQTICPACGAPLEYTGEQDQVRCNFCSTLLQVTEVEGQQHFAVLEQPAPQKEVLSNPVDAAAPAAEADPADAPALGFEDFSPGAAVYPAPESLSDANQSVTFAGEAAPPAYTPVQRPPASTNRNLWLIIGGVVVVLLLCLFLACLAFLAF